MAISLTSKEIRRLSVNVGLSDLYRESWRQWDRSGLSRNSNIIAKVLQDDFDGKFPNLVRCWDFDALIGRIDPLTLIELRQRWHERWEPLRFGWNSECLNHIVDSLAEIDLINEKIGSGNGISESFQWNWTLLSLRLSPDDLTEAWRRGYPVNQSYMSHNSSVTLALVDSDIGVGQWDWEDLSVRIEPKEILANPERPWRWRLMLNHRRVTWPLIERWLEAMVDEYSVGAAECLPRLGYRQLKEVARHIDLAELTRIPYYRCMPWSMWFLSQNKKIPTRWLLANEGDLEILVGPPDYRELSCRATIADYLDYPNRPWRLGIILSQAKMVDLFRTMTRKRWKKRHLVRVSDFRATDYWYFYRRPGRPPTGVDSYHDLVIKIVRS